jgi:ABC-2 type transport system permease protein
VTAVDASVAPTGPSLPVAPVLAPAHGIGHELRAARVVLRRDLQRFWVDKPRMVGSLVQPLLLLFVLGKGLATSVGGDVGGADYTAFLFPGTVVVSVLFPAVFSAISIVWDREFGFLREMLVAPIGRPSIVVGKCLGGGAVALLNGVVLLALAGLAGIPYHPLLLLGAMGVMFLTAFAITAFGLVLAVRIQTVQTLMPIVQLLLTPLMFLSGALFPAGGDIPTWLAVAARFNPIAYAVDAMQTVMFRYADVGDGGGFAGGLTWWGWPVPLWADLLVLAGTGLAFLTLAAALFSRAE